MDEEPPVSRFREYLRINTTSHIDVNSSGSKPDYKSAVDFLTRQAEEIGLKVECIEMCQDRPVLVLTWPGSDPSLPSLMLNSHMDVVPVTPEHWEVDPFAAHKRPNGDIVARGSQDMKCVGMWYLEAVRKMKEEGISLLRTIHITYVPDEEVGGANGMEKFVEREEFQMMNVGYCLDEGMANPNNAFTVFYGERTMLWLNIACTGNAGHGSKFINGTAMEKMHRLMTRILAYRDEEEKKLTSDPTLQLGDVTTVNVNIIKGGVQYNVVPTEVTVGVDIRISPHHNHEEILKMVKGWAESVGGRLEFIYKMPKNPLTSIDPNDPWWGAFSSAIAKSEIALQTEIFPAGTDSHLIRDRNISALGFSAIRNTPVLLHDHNEFLNEKVFLEGIGIYQDVIMSLANVRI